MLRQRLQDIGVMLPSGRRKQTELSLLTSLVESKCFCGSINYLGRGGVLYLVAAVTSLAGSQCS